MSVDSITPYSVQSIDTVEPITDVSTQILKIVGNMAIFILIILILTIIANWKIFSKAGEKGWKSIIPIYNTVILFKIAGLSGWWVLVYFIAAFIPDVGSLICLGITIYLMYKLAKSFGKGGGFTVGLVLLNTIFMMILAFGKAEYQLNSTNIVE